MRTTHWKLVIAALGAMLASPINAAEIRATISDASGAAVEDAVVLAIPVEGTGALNPAPFVVDQIDKTFVPYVSVIQAGTVVTFPNHDDVRHQVYSLSPAKAFELPLYAGTKARPILFDKPGVVTLGCNIHDWMIAYVYVADTPYFAKSGADGKAAIANLRSGEYTVRIWHPRMEGSEKQTVRRVTIDGAADVAFSIKLKPDFRPRRAPSPGAQGYR
jgi:plastocyanin